MRKARQLVKHRWTNQRQPPVEILWLDATSVSGDEWATWQEAERTTPAPTCTVGYIIANTANHVTVVATVNDHHIGHGITIPKGMITEMRQLT